jgi:hypothetical protein
MSLYGVCFVLAIGITAIYMWSNKYNRADAGEEVGTEEEVTERFRYPI